MWIDLAEDIYEYGRCDSISSEGLENKKRLEVILPYYLAYKALSYIPFAVFSSFITISLTYKSIINLIDLYHATRSPVTRSALRQKNADSCFCLLANVNDDNEIIYSISDLEYVMELLDKNRSSRNEDENQARDSCHLTLSQYESNYIIVRTSGKFSLKKAFIFEYFYKWNATFRFTSRFVNIIVVSLVSLYHLFLYWTFHVSIVAVEFAHAIPKSFHGDRFVFNPSDIMCAISRSMCLGVLKEMGTLNMTASRRLINFAPTLRASLISVIIVPCICAYVVCVIQVFCLVKETRKNLLEMYKGNCEFVRRASNLNKSAIASSSFHFGG